MEIVGNSHELLNGTASRPWMLLTSTMCPDLLEIIVGRTPATLFGHISIWIKKVTKTQYHQYYIFPGNVWPTFGQSAGAKVVNVHDISVQFQGDTLHRGLYLHAAVTDQHIHTAVTLQHLSHHVLHAVHVTEV